MGGGGVVQESSEYKEGGSLIKTVSLFCTRLKTRPLIIIKGKQTYKQIERIYI